MCRLIFIEGEIIKEVVEAIIWASYNLKNRDGYGIYNQYGLFKTLDFGEYVDYVMDHLAPRTLLHLRLASRGKVCKQNTHPFHYLGYYWAHNGTTSTLPDSKYLFDTQKTKKKTSKKTKYEKYVESVLTDITDTEMFIKQIEKIDENHIENLSNKYLSGVIYALSEDTKKLIITTQRDHYYACVDSKMHILSSQKDILERINTAKKIATSVRKVWRIYLKETRYKNVCKHEHNIKLQSLPRMTTIVDLT